MIVSIISTLCSIVIAATTIPSAALEEQPPMAARQAASYSSYDFMCLDIAAPRDGLQIAEGEKIRIRMEYEGIYPFEDLHFGLYLSDELEDINASISRIITEYDFEAFPSEDGKRCVVEADCVLGDLIPGAYALWAYAAKGDDKIEEMVFETREIEILARKGSKQSGWYDEDGKRYYGDDDYLRYGWQSIEGDWYYFDATGAMVTGWNRDAADWYYLDTYGKMLTGWQTIDGTLITGTGNRYFFDDSGVMARGWLEQNQQKFYFSEEGVMATGWQDIESEWNTYRYYFESTGHMATYWKNIDGEDYYFQKSGKMATGLKNIDGKVYVFGIDGKLLN